MIMCSETEAHIVQTFSKEQISHPDSHHASLTVICAEEIWFVCSSSNKIRMKYFHIPKSQCIQVAHKYFKDLNAFTIFSLFIWLVKVINALAHV